MALIKLKVVPGAKQDRVVGAYGDAIKIQVSAPPEGGKANVAVLRVLAEALGIKVQQIELVSGHTQARKVVRIDGFDEQSIQSRLVK
jgi:uncharacterized protein (TIGR00251 family)